MFSKTANSVEITAKSDLRNKGNFIISIVMAWSMVYAVGSDWTVQRPALPEARSLWGYVYQLLARTASAFTMEPLVAAVLFVASAWLMYRLLTFNRKLAFVEVLVCGIVGLLSFLCEFFRQTETLTAITSNAFQFIKTLICMAGWLGWFYAGYGLFVRSIQWIEERVWLPNWQVEAEKHWFWFAFTVLILLWLPHLIAKYPGVFIYDLREAMFQASGKYIRTEQQPIFVTLLIGLFNRIGQWSENPNIGYALFMALHVAGLAAVLAYSLTILRKLGLSFGFRFMTLLVYGIVPAYVGWVTALGKDTLYLIAFLLLASEMLLAVFDSRTFLSSVKDIAIFFVSHLLLILFRRNGVGTVIVSMATSILLLWRNVGWKKGLCWFAACTVGLGLSLGVYEGIMKLGKFEKFSAKDAFAIPFQQTSRVFTLHEAEMTDADKVIVDHVMDYSRISTTTDWSKAERAVHSFRFDSTDDDLNAYFALWRKQLSEYPLEYFEAWLGVNEALFDPRVDGSVYWSLTDNTYTDYVYKHSFNDMSIYNAEELKPLLEPQRLATEWYFDFPKIPLLGLSCNIGFCMILLAFQFAFLLRCGKHWTQVLVLAPSIAVAGMCSLATPLIYLRFALPFVCAVPLQMAAACLSFRKEQKEKQANAIDSQS